MLYTFRYYIRNISGLLLLTLWLKNEEIEILKLSGKAGIVFRNGSAPQNY